MVKRKEAVKGSREWPVVPIYDLSAELPDGSVISFDSLKGKKILIVNSASDCIYTAQYEGLEKLSRQFADRLVVLAFPANEFGNQEKEDDKNIAEFCRANYGISFPVFKKTKVKKGPGQHSVFKWLTDKQLNGWNDEGPFWNFCKYLVDEKGRLVWIFPPSAEPAKIKKILGY